jgi:hypothetical protein
MLQAFGSEAVKSYSVAFREERHYLQISIVVLKLGNGDDAHPDKLFY